MALPGPAVSRIFRFNNSSQPCCIAGCATGMDPQVHLQKISAETWLDSSLLELFEAADFTENSWEHGPIQRKMLELREKKVPLKTSEKAHGFLVEAS